MTSEEFVRKAVGLPWVDRACNWSAMDCWGVIVMYFRHVHAIEFPFVDGYETGEKTIPSGFNDQLNDGLWIKVDNPSGYGVAFTSYVNGIPAHVGVVIDGRYVLHSAGGKGNEGQVRCDRLESFIRLYRNTEFYQHSGFK